MNDQPSKGGNDMSTTVPTPEATSLVEDPFVADPEAAQPEAPASELDDIEKPVSEKAWKFTGSIMGMSRGQVIEETFEREYIQKPLSYLAMMQFTGLLGRKIDEAMSGDEGLSIESITSIADVASGGTLASGLFGQGDFAGVDSFVRGFAKIAAYVPDIIAEAQCIWLRVPYRDRPALVEVWSKPVDEGGLSMDEGEEMMNVFIDQNYEELERFFLQRVRRWAQTAARARKRLHPDG